MDALEKDVEIDGTFVCSETCFYLAAYRGYTLFLYPTQAVKGEACSVAKLKRRGQCAHILVVAILTRCVLDSPASRPGESGGLAGDSSGGCALPRTPQVLLKDGGAGYCSRLQETLAYLSRHPFPPTIPSGVRQVTAEPGKRFTVSQRRAPAGVKSVTRTTIVRSW